MNIDLSNLPDDEQTIDFSGLPDDDEPLEAAASGVSVDLSALPDQGDDESVADKLVGVGEAAATALTGLVSWIPGGVVKASGLVSGQMEEGTALGEEVQRALTYEPKTKTGQRYAGYVSAPFEWLSEKAQDAGDWVYDKTGSPLAGTAAKTAIEAIPFVMPYLAAKGVRGAKALSKMKEALDVEKPLDAPTVPVRLTEGIKESVAEAKRVETPKVEAEPTDYLRDMRAKFDAEQAVKMAEKPVEPEAVIPERPVEPEIPPKPGTEAVTAKPETGEGMDWQYTDEANFAFSEMKSQLQNAQTKSVTEVQGETFVAGSSYPQWFRDISKKHRLSARETESFINKYLLNTEPVPRTFKGQLTDRQADIYHDIISAAKKEAEPYARYREEIDALPRADQENLKSSTLSEIAAEEKLSAEEFTEVARDLDEFFTKRPAFTNETGEIPGASAKETLSLVNPETEIGRGPLSKTDMTPTAPLIKPETLEVMVKGGSTGKLPKYAEGSSINLERLDTTQDVKQFQNILTKAAEKDIGKRRVSWEETRKAAEELAWDDKEFLKQAKKKGGFSAAEIEAMRQINTNGLHDLFNTIKEMPADYSLRTDAARYDVLDKLNNYVEVMKETSRKSSEAGRALNIHKKMIQDNPEFAQDAYRKQVLKQMSDSLGGNKLTDQMIDDLKQVDFKDPQSVRAVIQKYHKAGLFDMFYEAWMNGILSAPTSHAANILGNGLTLATKIPESAIAKTLSGKSPLGEIKAESFGAWQGLKDGIRAGLKAFQTGVPSDMLTKIEMQRFDAIPGTAGKAIRIPTRSLTAADEFFKSIVYRMELNRQAYNIAEAEGLSGAKMAERMSKAMNDVADPNFKGIHAKAHSESLYRTFNTPLGSFGQKIMNMRDWKISGTDIAPLRFVVPFVRTPVNIAKFAMERTPFNFAKIANDYRTGKITGAELNQELAKPIVGSLISAATVMAALEGNITGAAPKNKKDRDLFYAAGRQPYSVKIGDKYYSYSRLEPIGSIMGMSADFMNSVTDDERTLNKKAAAIALAVTKNIASKTFMSGISKMLDAISEPERYGDQYIEQLAGSVIPSGVAAIARATDPYMREVKTPLQAIKARIPYLSQDLPERIGAFGKPVERPGSTLQRLLSPVTVTTEDQELQAKVDQILAQRKRERTLRAMKKAAASR